ncbi:MAG TPA: ATP-dependent DNA helicase [Aestuariivirgaceae bacterium]|nr:ATP-dependent DNA helicase [Aestuariivirgaceae bacterium]
MEGALERPDGKNGDGLAVAVLDGVGALVAGPGQPVVRLEAGPALERLQGAPHLVCHAGYLVDRLALVAEAPRGFAARAREQRHLDLAELFAFAAPAVVATPTPDGILRALGLTPLADPVATLRLAAGTLMSRLADPAYPDPREAAEVANFLSRANWPWAGAVAAALRRPGRDVPAFATGLNVWDRIAEWEDDGPRPPGAHEPVSPEEAQDFLRTLLGPDAEKRDRQMDYSAATTAAFRPRNSRHENHIVLAEAGTGLGKTLGYLAPAWLWARRNSAPVWISTFTKNLQRQLEQEARRLVPDAGERRKRIVIRKGRENYLCLLNMQEAFGRMGGQGARQALLAGLVARWARHTRDGDMVGGDFPAWLMSLVFGEGLVEGRPLTPMSLGLTDRRGECIYSACPHYRRCFIERAARAGRKADLVVANHALVLHQVAVDQVLGSAASEDAQDQQGALRRIVFDEGHHLFDAADAAFSGHLTGFEMAELRRWIRGPETRIRRGRNLADRLGDLIGDDETAQGLLDEVVSRARGLAGPGWQARVQGGAGDGPAEDFLALVRQQVLARAGRQAGGQSIETDCRPPVDGLVEAANRLSRTLAGLMQPMTGLARRLLGRLDEDAAELDSAERARIESLARSLKRRGELTAGGWIAMLGRIVGEPDPMFIEWYAVDQAFGREGDVGLHSHWIDPTVPFAAAVLSQGDGIVITSATLKDRPPEAPEDWHNAEMRTGVVHLPYPVERVSYDSPFDYGANARVIVVTDVNREAPEQVAAAYRELFLAAGGGGLGLFTAISRLKTVHRRLIRPLAQAGLQLYAQHVDPIDTGTLLDMFRADANACLLGTDAVRDGVDVPGESLRLIVLDRVPWSQPSIVERARRNVFGGNAYQDMMIRLKLRQAFGRLIRRAGDRGVFIVLDSRLASRFATAFPAAVAVERMGLVEALDAVGSFLAPLPQNG